MMLGKVADGVRAWLIGLFASAIVKMTKVEDRQAALQWLGRSREVVASDLSSIEKSKQLNGLIDTRAVAGAVVRSVAESVKNYRTSKSIPFSVKIALPATLAAIPLVGFQGAGIAAFGGAIGMPVLLLIFLGSAGITAIIEAVVTNPESRTDIAQIIDVIIEDERLRRASSKLKATMRDQPAGPNRYEVPSDEIDLRERLLTMDPFHFEQHTMSFFSTAGLESWVTKRSNDLGVDGFAVHPDGLIIVQCKRNATDNKVGRPTIQQFKGVVEEQTAVRGYIVTTASFTDEAKASAHMSAKLALVDLNDLVRWHSSPPSF